jgi:hypothetical protein
MICGIGQSTEFSKISHPIKKSSFPLIQELDANILDDGYKILGKFLVFLLGNGSIPIFIKMCEDILDIMFFWQGSTNDPG